MSTTPSILFTNLLLGGRTGSELHVLQLARAFKIAGWDVTCYGFVVAYPLQREFERSNIALVEYGREDSLRQSYDVVFAQHHVVCDYLLSNLNVSFKCFVVSVLGVSQPHEFPSHFIEHADLMLCVSDECKAWCQESIPSYSGPYLVLTNYADAAFFDGAHEASDAVHRVAVISNHIQEELFELARVVPEDVCIDYYGTQTHAVEVTPELLRQYDVVITIGRTVQCAMASGVPVYCYDRFGGPGYITPPDIQVHAYYNFSGRSNQHKRTAEELWHEISEGYDYASSCREELRRYAREHYSFDKLFESLLSHISAYVEDNEYHSMSAYVTPEFKNTSSMLAVSTKNSQASKFGIATCRVRNKEGDIRDVTLRYRYSTRIAFEPVLAEGERIVIFKPTNTPCICTVYTPGLQPNNEITTTPNEEVAAIEATFLTAHPTYVSEGQVSEIQFVVERYKGATIKLWSLYNGMRNECEKYEARCKEYEERCKEYAADIERLERSNSELTKKLASANMSVEDTKRKLRSTQNELTTLQSHMQSLKWTLGHTIELTRKRVSNAFSRKAQ